MDAESQLFVEQLKRIIGEQAHQTELLQRDVKHLTEKVSELSLTVKDQESRLRVATDGVVQFKTWSGLASGGSTLMALLALVRSIVPF